MKKRIWSTVIALHLLLLLALLLQPTPKPRAPKASPLQVATVKLQPKAPPSTPKPPPLPQKPASPPQKPPPAKKKGAPPKKKSPPAPAKKAAPTQKKPSTKGSTPTKAKGPPTAEYVTELSDRLQLLLSLPEYGSLKVALTLDRKGNVVGVEVLGANNEANEKYLMETLPHLTFPPFGPYFGDEREHTFSLTLNGDG